jgi:hypothetical protein
MVGKGIFRVAVTTGLILAVVLLLRANTRHEGDEAEGSACDLCQEVLIGSFSCAVQGGEVLAQVNFQGSGSLTPSPTGAGTVVLGGFAGGDSGDCESLAGRVTADLKRGSCVSGRLSSPNADQRVFDFACRGERSILVRVIGEVSTEVISIAP